jgi:hypothetical protein
MKSCIVLSMVLTFAFEFALAARIHTQQSKVALPRVSAAAVPLYPRQAYISNIEGLVRLKITTDGHHVVAVHLEDGNKLLAAAAEENARTWQFVSHEPTSFTLTYRYQLKGNGKGDLYNPTVVLRFPTEVEISTRRWPGTHDLPAEVK